MKLKRIKVSENTRQIIFHDLECLQLKNTDDNNYHYNQLRNNIIDLIGKPKEE